eukprot:188168_1
MMNHNHYYDTISKNKNRSRKVRKSIETKRKLRSSYEKNKSKKMQSKSRLSLKLHSYNSIQEISTNIQYTHCTKLEHRKIQKMKSVALINRKSKKYQYKSSRKRQTKKRKTVNIKKEIKIRQVIHAVNRQEAYQTQRYSNYSVPDIIPVNIQQSKIEQLKIQCDIFFSQKTTETHIYELRSIKLNIFHESLELIPCTNGQYKLFTIDDSFQIHTLNETTKEKESVN